MSNQSSAKGKIIILSAPSGGGKSSLAEMLLQNNPNITLSVSATTRSPRPGEQNGVHYFFKTQDEFALMQKEGQFLESAQIYDNYYGTPRQFVEQQLERGLDVLFDIDYQGAYQIMDKMPGRVVSIFVVPPSLDVLRDRLLKRGQDGEDEIDKRLALAEEEISEAKNYDHVVVNEDFTKALKEIENIIKKSHSN